MKTKHSYYWQIALAALIITTLSCQFFGTPQPVENTPTPSPTPLPLPAALVETNPLANTQLGLEQAVIFYFNQPMDKDSVIQAMSTSSAGSADWVDDSTLKFTPGAPYPPNSTVNFSFSKTAQAANGRALVEPISLDFATADYLQLTQFLPEEGTLEVSPTSAVMATFNQPVVALGANSGSQPAAFTLQPPAKGRGEWLNTSTYVFYPDTAFDGGVTYTASLNPDLAGTSSAPLQEARAWSFTVAVPKVVNVETDYDPLDNLPLDSSIKVVFNQPMNVRDVERNFSFTDSQGKQVPGKFEWNNANTELTFVPNTLLQRSTTYRLVVPEASLSAGGMPLTVGWDETYYSSGVFSVFSSQPEDNGFIQTYDAVLINFTTPVDEKTSEDLITVSPEPAFKSVYFSGGQINLGAGWNFNTTYTVTVSPEVQDKWGQKLGQPYIFSFSIADSEPRLTTFYSDAYLVRPDKPYIYAQTVNVNFVDIMNGSISLDEFLYLQSSEGYSARDGFTPDGAQRWTQPLDSTQNTAEQAALRLNQGNAPLPTGIYAFTLSIPGQEQTYPSFAISSNISMIIKVGAEEALVWVMDLRTNQPLAKIEVVLYDKDGKRVASGLTDSDGLWNTPLKIAGTDYDLQFTAVTGQPGSPDFGMVRTDWNYGVAAGYFSLPVMYPNKDPFDYVYTDRPIYRPGQDVFFRGILKEKFDGRYSASTDQEIKVSLNCYDRSDISSATLPVSEYGTFNGQFNLPASTPPGTCYFSNEKYGDLIYFTVAEYRKPEIELTSTLTPEETVSGEALNAEVNAQYYFGSPANQIKLDWSVYSRQSYFELPGYTVGPLSTGWLSPYGFSDEGYYGKFITSGSGETDAKGQFAVSIEEIPAENFTQQVTLESTVQDESGFSVSSSSESTVHPALYYLGVQPKQWVGQQGKPMGFNLLSVGWDKKPIADKSIRVEFLQITWERKEINSSYVQDVTYEPVYTPVSSQTLKTGKDGSAEFSATPPNPGTFVVRVSGKDEEGNLALTEALVWVGGTDQAIFPNLVDGRLVLTPDQEKYKPGDTALVFIPNPLGVDTLTLVTVERSSISEERIITLPAGGGTVEVDLTEQSAPNIYVSASLLGENNIFRQGYTMLTVDPGALELNVELLSNPERTGPNGEVTFDLRVTDHAGQPVQGEFSLSVVDKATLALAGPNSVDIFSAFYDIQPLAIISGYSAANFAERDMLAPAGGRGGGGGDEMMTVRENFPDTAYWSARVVTNADGRASVTLTLPDSLTTWQVETRGLTLDTRVGSAITEVVVTKDLLVRPVTPRFVVAGDKVTLGAVVNNNTAKEIDATVSLSGTGFVIDDAATATQKVSIPANGRTRVDWDVTVDATAAEADPVFSVQGGGLEDASRPANGALPIMQYIAPQAFTTSSVIPEAGSRTELVSVPRSFVPTSGGLVVELSPSLGATILSSLKALETPQQPWSAEQVVSYFLPNLVTYNTLTASGIEDAQLEADLQTEIEVGIQQLVRMQNYDGGWGWQPGGVSDPYISTYALFGLQVAKNSGFTVIEYSIEQARQYLAPWVNVTQDSEDWQINNSTFTAYALQLSGGVDPLVVDQLYALKDRLDPWAQAFLALTLESLTASDPRSQELLSNLQTTSLRTSTGVHWESAYSGYYNPSDALTTTAIVTYTLAQKDPASPLVADATRYLVSNRNAAGCWNGSYQSSWTIMALNAVMQGTGELNANYDFSADLNGIAILTGSAEGPTALTPASTELALTTLNPLYPSALTFTHGAGTGRLYYRAALTVYQPVELVSPLNAGMQVSRLYFDAACQQNCQPLTSAQLGKVEKVRVRVNLTLPTDAYYVTVEDYIPAGSEIVDTNLKTTAQGDGDQTDVVYYSEDDPFAYGWGWWWFGKARIYDEHIAWSAEYLAAGTYELTYVITPVFAGQYRVLPARAWMEYFPEVQGTSAGSMFEIKK